MINALLVISVFTQAHVNVPLPVEYMISTLAVEAKVVPDGKGSAEDNLRDYLIRLVSDRADRNNQKSTNIRISDITVMLPRLMPTSNDAINRAINKEFKRYFGKEDWAVISVMNKLTEKPVELGPWLDQQAYDYRLNELAVGTNINKPVLVELVIEYLIQKGLAERTQTTKEIK